MKKIAGLCIGEKFDQQLLGLNEKYDLLFIRKDQELILFSLETLEELSRYRCSGIPEVIFFTQSEDYAIVACRQGLSYRNKLYLINLQKDLTKLEFLYQGKAADTYRFTIHSLFNYPNYLLIGRKYSLELFDCVSGQSCATYKTTKEIHLVGVIESENEDVIAVRYVNKDQENANVLTMDQPDVQYYKLKEGTLMNGTEPNLKISKYFYEKTIRFTDNGNKTILTNFAEKTEQIYNSKLWRMGIDSIDREGQCLCGVVYFHDENGACLRCYSFCMDAKTLMPIYTHEDGIALYFYGKKNYLIYEEMSDEDYIAIVDFSNKERRPLTMEQLSKGKVKNNKVDSKGFKQIIL